jgi:hypothetical protein
MKTILALVLLSLAAITTNVCAQGFPTNSIGQAEAVRIASQFRLGMRERDLARVLKEHGLSEAFGTGSSFGWSSCYRLSDGCVLALEMKPEDFKRDGDWLGNGLLVSACIRSNGVGVVSITLTNALQPGGAANRSQPIRSETNRAPAAAGSDR